MICLTSPVGHIGALVRMPWVAMTETDIKYVYPKRGILPSLAIWKKGVGLSSESFGSRTGSIRTVFPFLCLKSWVLWCSCILCHFRWPLEWRWPLVAPELQDSPWGRLSNAKGERTLSLWLGRKRLGSLCKRKAPLWAVAHSWTNC